MKKILFVILIIFLCSNTVYAKRRHVNYIKRKLGVRNEKKDDSVSKGFKQTIGENYVIQVKDMSRQEALLILRHMERVLEEYLKLYEYPFGTQKCFVKVFGKQKNYKLVAQPKGCGDSSGFYYSTGVNNYVVTYNSAYLYSTLSHEAFHQFAEKAFNKRPPVWFNEGMACYYETSRFVNDRFVTNVVHRDNLFRAKGAISSKNRKWPKLKNLARLSYDKFYGKNASFNYAAAWSLVYYLKNNNKEAFKSFVDDLKLGKSFATCIRTNYNMSQRELEKEWLDYIIALPGS